MRWRTGFSSIISVGCCSERPRILAAGTSRRDAAGFAAISRWLSRPKPRLHSDFTADHLPPPEQAMGRLKVGDHVSWNSEAGRVSGRIIRVHTRDFDYKGHTHRASRDDPQYEIRSDRTDHIAAHRGNVLEKIG
jgi:hypothetical protein